MYLIWWPDEKRKREWNIIRTWWQFFWEIRDAVTECTSLIDHTFSCEHTLPPLCKLIVPPANHHMLHTFHQVTIYKQPGVFKTIEPLKLQNNMENSCFWNTEPSYCTILCYKSSAKCGNINGNSWLLFLVPHQMHPIRRITPSFCCPFSAHDWFSPQGALIGCGNLLGKIW